MSSPSGNGNNNGRIEVVTTQQNPAEDEKELPTIEVAGVNLTSNCFELTPKPNELRAPKVMTVHCSIETDSDTEVAMSVQNFTIEDPASGEGYSAKGVSGLPSGLPSTWQISKSSKVRPEFAIPLERREAMRAGPITLVMENLNLNGKAVPGKSVFKPKIRDFFTPHPLCARQTPTLYRRPLTFARLQLGGNGGFSFMAQAPSAPSKPPIPKDRICSIEFFSDVLVFQLTNIVGDYRVAGIFGPSNAAGGADTKFLFTDHEDAQQAFGFPDSFWLGIAKGTGLSLTQLMGGTNPSSSPKSWCVFGGTGCIERSPTALGVRLDSMDPNFLSAMHSFFLPALQGNEEFEIRFQGNSGFSGDINLNSQLDFGVKYIP